jgi:predicted RNA-binding protein with PIN domain
MVWIATAGDGLVTADRVLVVDGANVVGSRPDGWWRDRAGAAARLHESLAAADLAYDVVVLVLEGAARAGRPAGMSGGVLTVHAAGSGDDAIVDQVQTLSAADSEVLVVTADRGLRDRVASAGARVVGPSWLHARTS